MRALLVALGLTGLLCAGLVGGAVWLLHTSAGARWLLTDLPASAGMEASVGSLEGTLLGDLELRDYRLDRGDLSLGIEELQLRAHLSTLLPLGLTVDRLRLQGVDLQLPPGGAKSTDSAPPRLSLPPLPPFADLLQLDIHALQLNDLRWQQAGEQPQSLDELSAALHWRAPALRVTDLRGRLAPDLVLEGRFFYDFAATRLQLQAELENLADAASWQRLRIEGDLQGQQEALLQGEATAELFPAEGGPVGLETDLTLSETAVTFSSLQLRRAGQKGEVRGEGRYAFASAPGRFEVSLDLRQLDLEEFTGRPLLLSGQVSVEGTPAAYRGRLRFTSSGSPLAPRSLRANLRGDLQSLRLRDLALQWLGGEVAGTLAVGWQEGWRLETALEGRGLDPQHLQQELPGNLNFSLDGRLQGSAGAAPNGRLRLQLHESELYRQRLSGELALQIAEGEPIIEQLDLQGEGVHLVAEETAPRQLALDLEVARLQDLHPALQGSFAAQGAFDWRAPQPQLQLSGQAAELAYGDWQVGELQLEVSGGLPDHQLQLRLDRPDAAIDLQLSGAYEQSVWNGTLGELTLDSEQVGRWQLAEPVSLRLSAAQVEVAPWRLLSAGQAQLSGFGEFNLTEKVGQGELSWTEFPLGLLAPWVPVDQLAGQSGGSVELFLSEDDRARLDVEVDLQAELKQERIALQLAPSRLTGSWDRQGLRADLALNVAQAGEVRASLRSPVPLQTAPPGEGTFRLSAAGFLLERLHPWLPPTLNLGGELALNSSGSWQEDAFSLTGEAQIEEGEVYWQEDEGRISARLDSAAISWGWRDDLLRGELALVLQEQGEVDGEFRLPLASRWPLQTLPGELQASLTAKLQELGLLSLLFPGLVQESRGELNVDLDLSGSWQNPELQGKLHLFGAGAFVPTAGVQLEEVELLAAFDEQQLRLETFSVSSGGGRLTATGTLQLEAWRPGAYQLELQGERFRLIHLPDLELRVDPALQVSGDLELVRVRGRVLIPTLVITGKQPSSLPENSPDLVIVDAEEPPQGSSLKLRHDIDVRVELGKRVLVKTAGIDAKLTGGVRLLSSKRQELTAVGEIRVEKGRYASYGVNLDIKRGSLRFSGGPIEAPTLDILALREAGEVKAGVKISGTPQQPQVDLHSQPSMPDADILSYMVLGRPLNGDNEESDLLMSAAGALLSQGESVMLQEKVKQRLGLDTFDISAGDGDVTSSVITTGKYLSPDLYVSLGYSLFTNTNEVRLRYNLAPNWELESNLGLESGVDLYYEIDIE